MVLTYRIAAVQMDIRIGDIEYNLESIDNRLRETTAHGAWLAIFPECTTTGYCFDNREEVHQVAESKDGYAVNRIRQMCRQYNTHVVVGFIEREGDRIFNSVVLAGPDGLLGHYRKIHLPMLGLDRFVSSGDKGLKVVELPGIRLGLMICYDCSFPEAARVLALQGADLIVLPTNWPPTSGRTADLIPPARALENHVYFAAVNRIGVERNFEFIGKSRICDPSGADLASANHRSESILYAEIDPQFSRAKHLINIPGQHEIHRMLDRQPIHYQLLSNPYDPQ